MTPILTFPQCDETRPTCVNCRTAHTACSYYLSSSANRSPNVPVTPGASSSTSENNPISKPAASPAVARPAAAPNGQSPVSGPDVNMDHLRLFHRYLENPQQVFGLGIEQPELQHSLMLKHALANRFLMTLILAVTSLRQCLGETARVSDSYSQSMELLDAGLRELHKATEDSNEGNIAAIFLASNITGIYMLCDTFIIPHDESPDVFLDRIINTMKITRGVRAVVDRHWTFLAHSEVRPMFGLELRQVVNSCEDDTSRFRSLFTLIEKSALQPDEVAACNAAINQLLRNYGANSSIPHLRKASRFLRGRAWPVTTTALYIDLLSRRVPEALVIMAHWSVLLHQVSDVWAIGEAGKLLMHAVEHALGPAWDSWLAWPRAVLAGPRTPVAPGIMPI
ncbi:Transcriptional activator protein UGA3 [Sphaceloma murrayae]|uniref:Transcriptional activator protein UGA3 n=1 Tax=Sphaceloma murrayae TaxID=2082308 RepID=A0A2K1QZW8_9PEZI|nr:Transcriptional activator protein UGA3 [Sphaceloma murrayae]